jgi:hypothetical protein
VIKLQLKPSEGHVLPGRAEKPFCWMNLDMLCPSETKVGIITNKITYIGFGKQRILNQVNKKHVARLNSMIDILS